MRIGIAVLASVLLAFALVLAGHPEPTPPESHEAKVTAMLAPDLDPSVTRLVLELADRSSYDAVEALVTSSGATVTFNGRGTGIMGVAVDGPSDLLVSAVAGTPGVLSISPERTARTLYTPDDPGISNQWGLGKIEAYGAWDVSLGSHEVVVAVLDTGIDWNHPDISPNIWSNGQGYHGYNFIADNWFPMDDNVNGYNDNGDFVTGLYTYHGTHVAGIVGSATDNAFGMAGISQSRLMAVKVMNDSGEGTDSTVASGIRWSVDNGAHVIVMSLGVDGASMPLQNAVRDASGKGVVLVAAAGNAGVSYLSYPAAFPEVIAVGATDTTDRKATFSNYGTNLDLVAPGVNIYSTMGGTGFQYLSGTSAAAPHVAGVAALMLSVNPALTPVEVGEVMNQTAKDINRVGYDPSTGWGIVNAFEALATVAAPAVTITGYPEYVRPNGTYSVTWLVTGGDPGEIGSTYLEWGFAPGEVEGTTATFTGYTWAEFTVSDLPSLPHHGTIFLVAYAEVDGSMYESTVVELPVTDPPDSGLIMPFLRVVEDFILNDLGMMNFLILMCALVVMTVALAAARSRGRRAASARQAAHASQAHPSLDMYRQAPATQHLPPPPPPPPRFEAYVDVVGPNMVPTEVRVVEGTKVVWINRTWAPPPGVAVRSGELDGRNERPDGLFQSGLLIAPGDYWSCTFHRPGRYPYYLTGVWAAGAVVVEPHVEGGPQAGPDA